MRSWDGRLTTDSAAASLVAQTRNALGRLLLRPKLETTPRTIAGPNPIFVRKRS